MSGEQTLNNIITLEAIQARQDELVAMIAAFNANDPRTINVPGYPLMVRAVDYNTLSAQLAEAQAALKTVMRNAELSKEPCDPDPESPAAIRNGKFAGLASIAAQGLGMVRGPSLTKQLVEAQRDAERWRWLRDHARIFRQSPDMSGNHYWMVHATTTLRGPTLEAAIDAAKGEKNGT